MAQELDIFQDTTKEELFADSVMAAEQSLYGQGSKVGRSRDDVIVGDDGNFYNENGEQVYYWVRPRETDSTMQGGVEEMSIGSDVGGYYTESEIRSAWDAKEGMGYLKQQTNWDNYWGFITERQDLIQSGDLPDPTTSEYMADYKAEDSDFYPTDPAPPPNVGSWYGGGREEEKYYAQLGAAGQDASNRAMTAWVQLNSDLMNKYGLPTEYRNKDGDLFVFNGSTFTRSFKAEGPDYGKVFAAVMIGAFTAGAAGPAVGAVFGGGAAGGAATGVVSSVISQGVVNGKIDPTAVVTSGLLGGLGGWFDDLRAATPGQYGGWVIDGTQVGSASQFMIEKTQYLADVLGIPFNEASGIVQGVLNGTISGEDLEGIALNAVGGWSQVKIKDYLSDMFGEGVDVDNWFREGDSFIPTEALFPFVETAIQGAIDGGVSKTDLLKMLGGYFQAGGDLDFILPGLSDLDLESAFPDLDFDFCEKYPDFPGLCKDVDLPNVDLPDVNLPDIKCPEWMKDDEGNCLDIDCPEWLKNEDGECLELDFNVELCSDEELAQGGETIRIGTPDSWYCKTPTGIDVELCSDEELEQGGYTVRIGTPDSWYCKVPKFDAPDTSCPSKEISNGVQTYVWDQNLGECVPDVIECIEGFDLVGQECVKVSGGTFDFCSEPRPEEYGYAQINWDKYCSAPSVSVQVCSDEQKEQGGIEIKIGSPDSWYCKMPDTTCPEGFRNEDGECVKIEGPDVDVDVDIDLPSVGLPSGDSSTGMFSPTEARGFSYERQTPVAITQAQPVDAMGELNQFISRQLQKRSKGMLT